jgi:hypothetical protein
MNSTLRQVANPKATLRELPSPSWNRLLLSRWAPIPLRLIVGYGFMAHGFAKLTKGPDAFATILHALGVPAPHFMAWVTILTELLGGLAVILGAFVTLSALPAPPAIQQRTCQSLNYSVCKSLPIRQPQPMIVLSHQTFMKINVDLHGCNLAYF